MPQASEELRKKWGGIDGIGEDKACAFLESRGWKEERNGLWFSPFPLPPEEEWEALSFLCDEWDHAYGGVQPCPS